MCPYCGSSDTVKVKNTAHSVLADRMSYDWWFCKYCRHDFVPDEEDE